MRQKTTKDEERQLRAARGRVEEVLTDLAAATAERDRAARQVAGREHALRVAVAGLNPNDTAALERLAEEQTHLALLSRWLATAPRVWAEVANLRAGLQAAADAIRQAAQPRSVEEGTVFLCTWQDALARPVELVGDAGDNARLLTDTAHGVLRDIDVVLAARRGALLDDTEKRSGVLRVGSVVVRQLDPREIHAGVANE